jgi:hypothetical protein
VTRLLLLAFLVLVIWLGLTSLTNRLRGAMGGTLRGSGQGAARPPAGVTQLLVRCAACGTHVASGRALRAGGRDFCSEACRDRAAAPPPPPPPH